MIERKRRPINQISICETQLLRTKNFFPLQIREYARSNVLRSLNHLEKNKEGEEKRRVWVCAERKRGAYTSKFSTQKKPRYTSERTREKFNLQKAGLLSFTQCPTNGTGKWIFLMKFSKVKYHFCRPQFFDEISSSQRTYILFPFPPVGIKFQTTVRRIKRKQAFLVTEERNYRKTRCSNSRVPLVFFQHHPFTKIPSPPHPWLIFRLLFLNSLGSTPPPPSSCFFFSNKLLR